MGKEFKEIKNILLEAEAFVLKYEKIPKKDYPNLETAEKFLIAQKKSSLLMTSVLRESIHYLDIEEKYDFFKDLIVERLDSKELFNKAFLKCQKKVAPNTVFDENADMQEYVNSLAPNVKEKLLKEFDHELSIEIYKSGKPGTISNKVLLNHIENKIPNIENKELNYFDVYTIPKFNDIHFLHDQLDTLKNDNDIEFNNILNKADEILTIGEDDYLIGQIPEIMSQFNLAYLGKELDNKLASEEVVSKFMKRRDTSHAIYDSIESTTEVKKACFNRAMNSKEGISEGNAQKIKEFFAVFDKLGANTVSAEERIKVYGFSPLANVKKELEKAVTAGNAKKITDLTNKYNEMDKEYEKLFKLAKDINKTNHTPDNITTSRNPYIPLKYRLDYKSNGVINSMYYLYCYTKNNNLDIDTVLKSPAKVVMNEIKKNFIDNNYINEYFKKNGPAKTLLSAWGMNPFDFAKINSNNTKITLSRCFDNIIALEPDATKRTNLLLDYKIAVDGLWGEYLKLNDITSEFASAKLKKNEAYSAKTVVNLVTVEPEDFNYADFAPDSFDYDLEFNKRTPFDINKYIKGGRTTIDRVAYRIVNFIKDYANDENTNDRNRNALFKSLSKYSDGIIKSGNIASNSNTARLLNELVKNPYNPQFNGKRLNILKAEVLVGDYNKVKNNDNLKEAIKAITEVSRSYDSKRWIVKKMSAFARSENRHVNSLKENLVKAGNITMEKLDKAIDAFKNNNTANVDKILGINNFVIDNQISITIENDKEKVENFVDENVKENIVEKEL